MLLELLIILLINLPLDLLIIQGIMHLLERMSPLFLLLLPNELLVLDLLLLDVLDYLPVDYLLRLLVDVFTDQVLLLE